MDEFFLVLALSAIGLCFFVTYFIGYLRGYGIGYEKSTKDKENDIKNETMRLLYLERKHALEEERKKIEKKSSMKVYPTKPEEKVKAKRGRKPKNDTN